MKTILKRQISLFVTHSVSLLGRFLSLGFFDLKIFYPAVPGPEHMIKCILLSL